MITGNPDLDFFDQNPALKNRVFFREIVEMHPENYSKICWVLWYCLDPESPLYNVPPEVRQKELEETYYPDMEWELVEKYERDYVRTTMEKEKVLYKIAYDKLEDLTYDLKNKDLSNDKEWKQALMLLEKLSKLWDSTDTLKKKFEESTTKAQMKGGGMESPRERRGGGS